ncbi:hypothetical protein [Actinomadura rayongensis]|uniref:ATP-binding protein n=1 Tax=Actinomadura rayongensis TaxID=1429076 RepID=A0A6I4WAN7_9ACTN|nr:hypothetical protein [Actinomadura rayongensis]MXQ66651.1 hypothetical protein [Actinomadura rayongensis]
MRRLLTTTVVAASVLAAPLVAAPVAQAAPAAPVHAAGGPGDLLKGLPVIGQLIPG